MNKLLLVALLSLSCVTDKIQCNTPEQSEQFAKLAWVPNPELLPLLDHCYEDVKHPIINNGIMRSQGDLLYNLFGEVVNTPQEKELAKDYCKYLGMYLYFAQQLLLEDGEVADYVGDIIKTSDYEDVLNAQTMQMIKYVMPVDLFVLMNVFLRDACFQEAVEEFTADALEHFYNI